MSRITHCFYNYQIIRDVMCFKYLNIFMHIFRWNRCKSLKKFSTETENRAVLS